jgi:hypothetical protein
MPWLSLTTRRISGSASGVPNALLALLTSSTPDPRAIKFVLLPLLAQNTLD